MTGLLTDLMHDRADHLDVPDLDLAEITRDGDRRLRRRRTALAGGLAAAAAVAALAIPTMLSGGSAPGGDDLVADGTNTAPRSLSWITGSTLHRLGEPDVDLGVDVRAWVWVGDDIVFTDGERRVRLWAGDALDVIGEAAEVEGEKPELVSDGSFVSWVDTDHRVVRHDVTDGSQVRAPDFPGTDPRVTAVDGASVYAVDTAGVYAWQPTDPDSYRTLGTDPGTAVIDSEGGTLLRATGDRRARVSGPGRDVTLTVDSFANLSPSGAHVVAESNDEGVLMDTATGDRVALVTGYEWALPFQWLDDDTVAVLAFAGLDSGGDEKGALLPCAVSTGTCGDATDLPSTFQLPIGIRLDQ